MKTTIALFLNIIIFCTQVAHAKVSINTTSINSTTEEITVAFDFKPGDYIYQDLLHASVDDPAIKLSSVEYSISPTTYFDPEFATEKKIFNKPFTMKFLVQTPEPKELPTYLRIAYYQHSQKKISETLHPIIFHTKKNVASSAEEPNDADQKLIPTCPSPAKTTGWTAYLQSVVQTTQSTPIRIIFALLLGLLLSLTPCIYPMIPITVGILQAHAQSSVLHNFALAASYSAGIATTFALLGMFAAFTGTMFGSLMTHPITIVGIIAVLLYLAFSMLGFYEMYVPKLFKSSGNEARGGSLIAAFSFGALSGTVASPCLSPGLLLLLSLVTTLGSMFLGFILLFAFGIGLSIPLLIIGTFSSSLHALPKAGAWMIEIKKIFGLMMIGMCFYFIQPLISPMLLFALLALACLIAGIYCFWQSKHAYALHTIYTILGITFIALVPTASFKCYQEYASPAGTSESCNTLCWHTTYESAIACAQEEKKLLFIDISGPFCSICKAIDKKIISHAKVQKRLASYSLLKIDNVEDCESHKNLCKELKIVGVPTLIVLNTHTREELGRWGSELYDQDPTEFARQLKKIRQA